MENGEIEIFNWLKQDQTSILNSKLNQLKFTQITRMHSK